MYESNEQMYDTIVKSMICVRADVGHAMEIVRLARKLPPSFRTRCQYGRCFAESVVPTTVRPLLEQAFARATDVLLFNEKRAAQLRSA